MTLSGLELRPLDSPGSRYTDCAIRALTVQLLARESDWRPGHGGNET
jgi:hypothetical protein